jgi:hypothetical protein
MKAVARYGIDLPGGEHEMPGEQECRSAARVLFMI